MKKSLKFTIWKYVIFVVVIIGEHWLMYTLADIFEVPEEQRWVAYVGQDYHWVSLFGLNMIFLTIAALLLVNAKTIGGDKESFPYRRVHFPVSGWSNQKNLYFSAAFTAFLIVAVDIALLIEAILKDSPG